ncbi:MAG: S-layer homology domain-containing protein [Candidatus Saganbacteria bacterium]|nr:S-layer homology domain-containing protein [Candidatus Saganbacteria bacterium]
MDFKILAKKTLIFGLLLAATSVAAEDLPVLSIFLPFDRTVVTAASITVEGSYRGQSEARVYLNLAQAVPGSDGDFSVSVPLEPGKNNILAQALDRNNKVLGFNKCRVLRLASFADLDENYWAKPAIEAMATLGIITGFPDGTFGPNYSITRAQLATWLIRSLGEEISREADQAQIFSDVPPSHWAFPYINLAASRGLVQGYPDGTFRPENTIIRAETVAVVVRLEKLPLAGEETPMPYLDIKPDYWAADLIKAAYEAKLTTYIKTAYFQPADQISRGEAANLLSRSSLLVPRINWLLDWEQGYF